MHNPKERPPCCNGENCRLPAKLFSHGRRTATSRVADISGAESKEEGQASPHDEELGASGAERWLNSRKITPNS